MSTKATRPAPNPIDVHVGASIRLRRRDLKISQTQLAKALGLTFQQVQKYERGDNRVSASKLYDIASALKVGVDCFFEGLPEPTLPDEATAQAARREPVTDFLHTAEGQALASQFLKISRPRVRRHVLDLVRALAHDEPPDQ